LRILILGYLWPRLFLSCLAGLVFCPVSLCSAWDPEPFRREDAIRGRDIEYNQESFLHRFSYRFRPSHERRWNRRRQGLRGSVGSVRSSEFYVFEELRKRWELDDSLFVDFFHKSDEDFDGPYMRTLTGIGACLGAGWAASVSGEFEAQKENIDVYADMAWENAQGSRFRAAVVAPDATFNAKSDSGSYTERPLTLFSESLWCGESGSELGAWLNLNLDVDLDLPEESLFFTYGQFSAGGSGSLPLGSKWRVSVEGEGGQGDRTWETAALDERSLTTFDRRHGWIGLQLDRKLSEELTLWLGARHFSLTEDRRSSDPTQSAGEIRRRENLLHAGVEWQIRDDIIFWPGVYINLIDNSDTLTQTGSAELQTSEWNGKVALPVEIRVRRTALVTLNPTMHLHRSRFGGGNIQVQLLF